ncbi:MAG: hypothetical protein ACLTTH_09675 [Holdemanella porci]
MIQHRDLETILSESWKKISVIIKYYLSQKEKAIVITNDVSVSVSEKLSHLLKNSLPKRWILSL